MIFLCFADLVKSQDFAPSQQAQGLLESKNVTVDHATGIFHYKVPLYTLKSGDYELPISLDYVGKGVKVEDDLPGLLGYNWTLNTGGVVTRTVRGGIADEKPLYGFLWTETSSTPLSKDAIKVNRHLRDGECDIFTAVFGNRSVNFIIRKDEDDHIYAEPLEITNVRIMCLQQTGNPNERIDGWIITDEAGNCYTYRQKEYTRGLSKEDAITINGVLNEEYVSSWYLSEIKPLNGEAIRFSYRPEKLEDNKQAYLCESEYAFSYVSQYQYGRAMREYPFDFGKYESDFKQDLRDAAQYIEYHAEEILRSTEYASFSCANGWVYNPAYRWKKAEYELHRRILGTLSSFEKVSFASASLIYGLETLENYYKSQQGMGAVYAVGCFADAKKRILDCLNEVEYNSEKVIGNFLNYRIQSPILERIIAPTSEVEFLYRGTLDELKMTAVNLYSHPDKERFSQILFGGGNTLEKVSFFDKDSVMSRDINFSYYVGGFSGKVLYADPWGYAAAYSFPASERFILDTDPVNCTHLSLKTITTPDKGSIHLAYEPNHIFKTVNYDNHPTVLKLRYGGIRLSSIVMQSGADTSPDTISYIYPVTGTLVYDDYYNHESLRYADFTDKVFTSKVKNRGVAFLNTGNNGMYYKHVIEHFSGRGSTSYLFHTPHVVNSYIFPYAFWMNALPLATALYDENGNIKSLKKNIYYADLENQGVLMGLVQAQDKEFFAASDSLACYTKQIPQLQCYEYYMNADELSKVYMSMPYVDLGYGKRMRPYEDIYLYNILPRTTITIPRKSYDLYYGGATLLKEQQEYIFEGHVTDSISISDFYNLGGTPYRLTEYDYNDLNRGVTAPTQIKLTNRNGENRILFQKSIAGMDGGDEKIWKKMKEMNVLSPVVKTAILKNGYLLEETISCYDYLATNMDSTIVLSKQYTYRPESILEYEENNQVFSYAPSVYTQTLHQKYRYGKSLYYPIDVCQRSGQTAYIYSEAIQRAVLKAENVPSESLTASDLVHLKDNPKTMSLLKQAGYMFEMAISFWDGYTQMDKEAHGVEFLEYTRTEAHARIIRLIEILATHDPSVNMEEIRCTLDSVKNQFDYINKFMVQYGPVVSDDANFKLSDRVFTYWIQMFRNSSIVNPELFEYAYWQGENELCIKFPNKEKWEAVLLGYNGKLTCQIVCDQGVVKQELLSFTDSSSLLSLYRLDLSSYSQVQSIKLALPSGTDYGLLVPERTDYEATSYNSDGTIHARFDQTGVLQLYEYDASGRIICVKDVYGNITQEYEYNNLVNQ